MPTRTSKNRAFAFFDPRPANWPSVIVLGAVVASAVSYVVVALTGAPDAIEHPQPIFTPWWHVSVPLLPVFVLVELAVLWLVRRRMGPGEGTFTDRLRALLDPRPARWPTVIALGVVLAYANGYLVVAVTGAAGAIQRTQHPFTAWLEESAVMVPLFILAELLVLRLIRRRIGLVQRSWRTVVVSALLIAVAGTITGFITMSLSAAYDFRLQTQLIDFSDRIDDVRGIPLIPAGTQVARGNCNSTICNEERFSLAADARGVAIATPLLLGINLVMVTWVLAAFGGRLGAPVRRRTTAAAKPDAVPVASGQEV